MTTAALLFGVPKNPTASSALRRTDLRPECFEQVGGKPRWGGPPWSAADPLVGQAGKPLANRAANPQGAVGQVKVVKPFALTVTGGL
jgi:hypothetical protein